MLTTSPGRLLAVPLALLFAITGFTLAHAQTTEYFDHAAFQTATGGAALHHFDLQPTESVIDGTEFGAITIEHIDGAPMTMVDPRDPAPGLDIGEGNVDSLPNGLSSSFYYGSPGVIAFDDSRRDAVRITFDQVSFAAGLWIGNVGAFAGDTTTPTTVTFFAPDGAVLATETYTQGHVGQIGSGIDNRFFYGIVTSDVVHRVEVVNGSFDGDGILVDNVFWRKTSVNPIPALSRVGQTMLGLLLGTSLFFVVRRAG